MAFMTRMPVASAVESLKTVARQVVLADVVVDDHPRPGKSPDELGHVAKLVPRRKVEDDDHLAIGEFARAWTRCAEMLEQGLVRVEKVIARGRRARR